MAPHSSCPDAESLEAAEALLALSIPPKSWFLNWGSKRKRSNPNRKKIKNTEVVVKAEEEAVEETLSPSTPLSFTNSTSTEAPPTEVPPTEMPPPRVKAREQHKERVKEQTERIAVLSANKLSLQQNLLEMKRHYLMLREKNSWLKQYQYKIKMQMQERLAANAQFGNGIVERRRHGETIFFTAGPTNLNSGDVATEYRRRQLAAERQRRVEECAAARKRRIETQKGKASYKKRRLR